jgi:hypothetical protein
MRHHNNYERTQCPHYASICIILEREGKKKEKKERKKEKKR